MRQRPQGRSFAALLFLVILLYWTVFLTFESAKQYAEPPLMQSSVTVRSSTATESQQRDESGRVKPDQRIRKTDEGKASNNDQATPKERSPILKTEEHRVSTDEETNKKNVEAPLTKALDTEDDRRLGKSSTATDARSETVISESDEDQQAEEGFAGERLTVTSTDEDINEDDLAKIAELGAEGRKYFPETRKPKCKYFFYQPSGGWGNQRFILRWAMIVANAMNRTLAVAPLAPHSDIWSGYNQWQKHEVVPADRVLDSKALNEAVERGVVFLDDIPFRVLQKVQNETKLTVKVHVKGHYVNLNAKVKRLLIHKESEIRETWLDTPEDIVFWDKMSMWQCCVPDVAMDSIWYSRHIMFNHAFKTLAKALTSDLGKYNAVHVRRGDMTISKDRRTAEVYYRVHHLERFDKTLPLYVATNEKDLAWFDALKLPGRFTKLVFWRDLNQDLVKQTLENFPATMKGDIAGFIDMLICGNAVKWEGSRKSTFSAAISAVRIFPQLRSLTWDFPMRPSLRKKLSPAEIAALNAEAVKEEAEDLLLAQEVAD